MRTFLSAAIAKHVLPIASRNDEPRRCTDSAFANTWKCLRINCLCSIYLLMLFTIGGRKKAPYSVSSESVAQCAAAEPWRAAFRGNLKHAYPAQSIDFFVYRVGGPHQKKSFLALIIEPNGTSGSSFICICARKDNTF